MLAKHRPLQPIMTLVVPYLKNEGGLRWKLEGRSVARQSLLTSGLMPVLAAPTPSGKCQQLHVHESPPPRTNCVSQTLSAWGLQFLLAVPTPSGEDPRSDGRVLPSSLPCLS